MSNLLDLLDILFVTGDAVEAARARKRSFCEKLYRELNFPELSFDEVFIQIGQHSKKLHEKGVSLEEAFDWLVMPKMISASNEEVKEMRENFRKRFESPKLLNAFHDKVLLRHDPAFWIILLMSALMVLVPIITYWLKQ